MTSQDAPPVQYSEKLPEKGSFLYRARIPVYVFLFLILWHLNKTGGPPLLSRFAVPGNSEHFFLKLEVFVSWAIYFSGVFFRSLGTAYIGRQKIWSPALRTDNTQTTGPFRYLRHPVYTGSFLILFSLLPLCSFSGAIFILSTAGSFTFYLAWQEESAFLRKIPKRTSASTINRFWPQNGFWKFLRQEGFKEMKKKKAEILRSEFYNFAFGAGFLLFSLSLSVQKFWYAFLSTLILLSAILLLTRGRSTSSF